MLHAALMLLLSGQPAASVDPCVEAANCRVVRDFELRTPRGGRVPVRTGERNTPWIVQDNVLLTPGDSLTVRFERQGEGLVPRRVRAGRESARSEPRQGELRLSFAQARDAALVLTAESRLDEALSYTAILANMARPGPQQPPVCPLAANATTRERFNAPIVSLTLARFQPARPGATCGVTPAAPVAAAAAAEARVEGGRLVLPIGRSASLRMEAAADGALRPVLVGVDAADARLRTGVVASMAAQASREQRRTGDEERLGAITGAERSPPPPADQLRLTFGMGPDGRSRLLMAENGYPRVVDYRAVMRLSDGRSVPTTICRVAPGLPVFESWSDPIVALELSGFALLEPGADPRGHVRVCD